MEGLNLQDIIKRAIQEYRNSEPVLTAAALKAELEKEYKKRAALERRLEEALAGKQRVERTLREIHTLTL